MVIAAGYRKYILKAIAFLESSDKNFKRRHRQGQCLLQRPRGLFYLFALIRFVEFPGIDRRISESPARSTRPNLGVTSYYRTDSSALDLEHAD